jgi:hypothetical protein
MLLVSMLTHQVSAVCWCLEFAYLLMKELKLNRVALYFLEQQMVVLQSVKACPSFRKMYIQALINTAILQSQERMAEDAQANLSKAVALCQVFKFKDLEITIYEQLGMLYYYQGDLATAQSYHKRFVLGHTDKEVRTPELVTPAHLKSLTDQFTQLSKGYS